MFCVPVHDESEALTEENVARIAPDALSLLKWVNGVLDFYEQRHNGSIYLPRQFT